MNPNPLPVIGISSYVEPAAWGAWHVRAALVPYSYVEAVRAAGACPVMLPPDGDAARSVIDRLDGLVLAGGADIGPDRYGAEAHAQSVTRPDRDEGEVALARAALDVGLPILGVCRGAQLLAILYGGSLHQHLPDLIGHRRHQPEPGVFGTHGVRLAEGSLAASVFGSIGEVNSYHHQGIDDPGGLAVTGWAEDGVVEAVEDPQRPFVLGVQWHPEEAADVRPFAALAQSALIGSGLIRRTTG